MAIRRSSASSSSTVKSALRVTRNRWLSTTSMPVNRSSRFASMTWSIGMKWSRLDLEEAGQDLRHLDPGEDALAGLGVAQPDRDREAERRDVRERVPGVDRERRQDREDLVEEALAQRGVVLRDLGVVDDLDALGGQRARGRSTKIAECSATSSRTRSRAAASCSAGVRPSGARGDGARLDLLAQAGDADLEELVEVAREDRQELRPLEQGIARRRGPRAGRAR